MSQLSSHALLPRDKSSERPLFIVMIIMAFLAALTLLSSRMSARSYNAWQGDLNGAATVQLMELNQDKRTERVRAAVKIINNFDKTLSPKALRNSEERALVQPWLGDVKLPSDITLPALITLKADQSFQTEKLANTLKEAGFTATVTRHDLWQKDIIKAKQTARFTGSLLLIIILCASGAIILFGVQSAMSAQFQTLSVFRQIGATDSFISRLYLKRSIWLSVIASVIGAGFAHIFISTLKIFFGGSRIFGIAHTRIDLTDIAALFVLCGLLIIVCALATLLAVRALLSQQ